MLGGILHDPEVYEDPEMFKPDRYMESDVGTKKEHENDIGQRNDLTFGGGRVRSPLYTPVPMPDTLYFQSSAYVQECTLQTTLW